MKLSKIRDEIYYFSEKSTEFNSKLNLAGIAIIWMFIFTKTTGEISITPLLAFSLFLYILSIFIDVIYNLLASRIWNKTYENHLKNLSDEEKKDPDKLEKEPPPNKAPWTFFYIKIGCTVCGYIILFAYLTMKIFS